MPTSHSSTSMRQLVRWSDSSFKVTTPRPCQGEPSRCMARLLIRQALEITGVDHLQARRLDREPQQPAAGGDYGGGGFGPHVALGQETKGLRTGRLNAPHARD